MIKAEILADSINQNGDRITTLKVVFPRIVLAEFNTHRMFSRNSASSRAIPTSKMLQMIEENPFIPIAWQKNHKGMQGTEYFVDEDENQCRLNWLSARDRAVQHAKDLINLGATKQIINRLLEPFMWHTAIITATEFENFFKLRCPQYITGSKVGSPEESNVKYHRSKKDVVKYLNSLSTNKNFQISDKSDIEWLEINQSQAEIHIQAAAEAMWDAMNESTPKELQPGEWHIPYGDDFDNIELLRVGTKYVDKSNPYYKDYNEQLQVMVAIARCARLSYQTLGDNPVIDYEKDLNLHSRLAKMEHWSPFEHVARAMTDSEYINHFKGDLSMRQQLGDEEMYGWCRNYKGFRQYRSIID